MTELYNFGDKDVDLSDFTLLATDASPTISLSGVVGAGKYYILERR